MKKFIAILSLFCVSFSMYAHPVTPAAAWKAAQVFYGQTMPATLQNEMPAMTPVTMPYIQTNASEPEFYIYSTPGTFIIIAGDDASVPVVAYSNEGTLSSGKSVPEGFIKWMDKVKREIQYIREQHLEADEAIAESWNRLLNNKPLTTATNAVSPLIVTKWDQSPYYNALCPYDNTYSQRTVVGCVATAMAQIMKYYNYPATGTGSHSYNHARYGTLSANFGATTYNWSSMPNSISSANSAVATLSYHCGVAVDMDYNVGSQGGSGAYPSALPNAYKNYFGYASTVTYYTRSSYADATWINMMKAELDAARPVQYSGQGTNGGHSFIMDGYDNSNNFHFNWGWSGSSDGYFAINALNPGSLGTGGGSGGFNAYQTAIIGIKPPNGGGGGGSTMDMRLYSAITVNPNPINYNSAFTVSCQVANYGTTTAQNFSGDFTAAVFNSSNQFVSYIETKTGYTLNYNSYFTNPVVFSTSAISALTPGTYTIGVYYKQTGASQWTAFGNGAYQNFISVVVKGNDVNDLKLYAPVVTTPTIITQNQTFTVTFDIANYGTSTFNGIVTVDIHSADGTWIRELDRKTGLSLPSNTHFTSGLTYTISGGISDAPGTYQLFIWDQPSGGSWENLGSGTYANPITITVVAPGLSPDGYENNNSQASAAMLNMNFSGTTGSVKTSGTNIHNGTDIDYYYIDLPSGYNYTLSPRVHDGYNTGDGNTYTCDVTFAYSTDGVNYSSSIDDVMSGNITKNGGGRVYFVVSPFFTGKIGTYSLEVRGTRTVAGGLNAVKENTFLCYPNPAQNYVNLALPQEKRFDVSITDINGRVLGHIAGAGGITEIQTGSWLAGIYFVKAVSESQEVLNAKFIINR